MQVSLSLVSALIFFIGSPLLLASEVQDSAHLEAMFLADQEIRSAEQREAGKAPTLQEERERRIEVFKLIAGNQLQTPNDYLRAGVILHHTSSISDENDKLWSLGAENHLLAFFLFKRAAELGHESNARIGNSSATCSTRSCWRMPTSWPANTVERLTLSSAT